VGSGGREHALVRAFERHGHHVAITPGRPGCIPGSFNAPPEQFDADLFVVGPEAPLVDGLADRLRAQGKLVFGPGADGAQLEGSKIWMKDLLWEDGVPTASYKSFLPGQEDAAEAFIRAMPSPWVIKTSYLMGGKGVLVTADLDEAIADARAKLARGAIVIEQALSGREFSVFAIADGHSAVCIGSAQDYKYLQIGGESYMTGGVGSYAPVSWVTDELQARVMRECIEPTLRALQARGIDYRGFLYWGGMLTDDGAIMTLEYNIRLGDPEAQVVLPRIDGDLAVALARAASGQLDVSLRLNDSAAVCVVLCAEGYPSNPVTGPGIVGIADAEEVSQVHVLQAGTRKSPDGFIEVAAGRCLNVVGQCEWGTHYDTPQKVLEVARVRAYDAAGKISWPGMITPDYIAADS
jgi:phosphoribosylamine--glycine ligase